jgi:hypothetical protein
VALALRVVGVRVFGGGFFLRVVALIQLLSVVQLLLVADMVKDEIDRELVLFSEVQEKAGEDVGFGVV